MVMDDTSVRSGNLPDESATLALGACMAAALQAGVVIFLGDLGAGKTTFTRGLLAGLAYHGKVKAPPTLVESYPFAASPSIILTCIVLPTRKNGMMPVSVTTSGDTVCLVEWPDKAGALLPPPI
jgi:tRNA threonylcarbamoyladenosine biosynthesis protein TsaE